MIHDAVLTLPCFSVDDYYMSHYSSGSVGFVWRGRKFELLDEKLSSTVCFQMRRMTRDVVGTTRSGLTVVLSHYCESPMDWHLVAGSSKPLRLWIEKDGEIGIEIYYLARDKRLGIYVDENFRKWKPCEHMFADLAFRYFCIELHFAQLDKIGGGDAE
jgi:hypothetical protein